MSTLVRERPAASAAVAGAAGPARRAIVRWSWRLFRREWRQQVLVLALVAVSVAATFVGVALASNAAPSRDSRLGTATAGITVPGADRAAVATARRRFGTVEEIDHQTIAVPGSLDTLDLRAQDPDGPYSRPTLRLLSGRYPSGPGEVALTGPVAATFDVRVGAVWHQPGHDRTVVGLVENPLDLGDAFALVAPGQANPPDRISILADATRAQVEALPTPGPVGITLRGTFDHTAAAVVVLALETIGLLFVGLVAAAGFGVMAQRRLRALGMLGALGATDRHVRLAMVANGAVVGVVGALAGALAGMAAWIALAPWLETLAQHRIDRFNLPWWAIAVAMLLAVLAAIVAAWWPARSVSRASIVTALSGRPSPPKAAHRFATLGVTMLAVGLVCLAFANHGGASRLGGDLARRPNPGLIIAGIVATPWGMLALAPLAIRGLASAGRRAPIALRLALRDLARYQARSAAALGAISLALAISATVAISATAAAGPRATANLPANQAIVYLSAGSGAKAGGGDSVPDPSAAQLRVLQQRVDTIGRTLHATAVVPLTQAFHRSGASTPATTVAPVVLGRVVPVRNGLAVTSEIPLYVATPALLRYEGIDAHAIDARADVLTSRAGVSGLSVMVLGPPGSGSTACRASHACKREGAAPHAPVQWRPTSQAVKLPAFTSDPNTLLTPRALRAFGLEPVASGWLVQAPAPLTTAEIDAAQRIAGTAGLVVETRKTPSSLDGLRNGATAIGLLLALGVLAMTVGLIRSETANDLRTLAATGATSTTRRTLTGATAGALALLGAFLGTGGAYLALVAWHRSDLHPLASVPVPYLAIILVGLPLTAIGAGWLLAGREPPMIARRPLE